jgi:cytochrome c553
MKRVLTSMLVLAPVLALAAEAVPQEWAYPAMPPGYQVPPGGTELMHLPGTTKAYTEEETRDAFNPPDWYPNEHASMPEIVAHGKKPDVMACALCHVTMGYGHPESANIAGLPAGYIEEQLHEFANGDRASMLPGRSNNMIRFAKNMTEDEIKQAAAYFSAMKPVVWTKVVETDMVAKSYVGEGNMRFAAAGNAREPIGRRIIELPENEERAKLRDPHSPFVAYVPTGSIKAGELLATTGGNGKTIQCNVCHGSDYKGIGNVPPLAGRSAIYLFRQLNDIQHGTRHGNAVALMQPVVAKLTEDDMIALAAFMASRAP